MLMRAILVCAALALPSPSFASTDEPLPTPDGLEADVKFWEAIFSKYKPEHCVFHDKVDLSVVYAAKRLPGATPRLKAHNGRRYVNAIRLGLAHLAKGGSPRNKLEQRIVDVTPEDRRDALGYHTAIDNVRCQRGVDLSPSLERSRRHLSMVKRVLKQRGLPTDLAYLPHLESGYHTHALSKAGARGIWQLMPATAREIGVRVKRGNDQRTNPAIATAAAAKLLERYYRNTSSWPLAITAYNYGPNGVARAVRAHGTNYMTVREKHRTSMFGFAARNYYPSFLAARNVALKMEKGLAAR